MNHLAIVRVISTIALGFSGLFLATFLVALASGEAAQQMVFAGAGATVGGFGATVLLLTDKPKRRAHARDGLAVAILFWIVGGLIASIPFFDYIGAPNLLAAFYESVSNLSTTGHSQVDPALNPMPTSIFVWRALLHLIGAIASVAIAATVFSGLNLGGPGVHRNRFFSEPEGSFFDPVPRVVRVSAILILSSTIVLSAFLLAIGLAPRDALAGAVSAITTGLVDPAASATGPAGGALHSALLWIGLVIGTLGLIAIDGAGQGRVRAVPFDPETLAWFGTLVLITVLAFLAGLPLARKPWLGNVVAVHQRGCAQRSTAILTASNCPRPVPSAHRRISLVSCRRVQTGASDHSDPPRGAGVRTARLSRQCPAFQIQRPSPVRTDGHGRLGLSGRLYRGLHHRHTAIERRRTGI